MKIVVALDKFKGSLTAPAACEIVRRALLANHPDAHIVSKPMADGGDGTARAMLAARAGEWIACSVTGPLRKMRVTAGYGWFPAEQAAIIEMATASGLALLQENERDPLRTTTYGTGELIAAASAKGATHVWLAVGGSATVDGGVGAAQALGWQFLDAGGQSIGPGGGELSRIMTITAPKNKWPSVEVLTDVENPLCGPNGSARVFGPQKGATPEMVEQLDAGLRHLAGRVKDQLGKNILDVPGAGAAGGLAAGALAFLDARLAPGIETVMTASGLAVALADADWVITGEGQFDDQSLHGKVVDGVAGLAQKTGVKVAVLAGRIKLSEADWRQAGVAIARAITPATMSTGEAMKQAEQLLFTAARTLPLRPVK